MNQTMRVEWKVEQHRLCVGGQAVEIPGPVHTLIFTKTLETTGDRRYAVFVDERMLAHLRAMLEDLLRHNPDVDEVAVHQARLNALGRLLRECRLVMQSAV